MPRVIREGQLRSFLEYPSKGQDEDFYNSVQSYIGKDYQGGDLSKEDFNIIWDNHNKDIYDKQDALAERREAAVAQANADREAGIATYKAIEERLADPNWRNMNQIAKALGLNSIASAFGMLQDHRVEPIKLGVEGRYVQPGSGVRYGLWAETLDVLLRTLEEEKQISKAAADEAYKQGLAEIIAEKERLQAIRDEKSAAREVEFQSERAETRRYNEVLAERRTIESRRTRELVYARRRVAGAKDILGIAVLQLESVLFPERRAEFLHGQASRPYPGGSGFTYDRHTSISEERASKVVEDCRYLVGEAETVLERLEGDVDMEFTYSHFFTEERAKWTAILKERGDIEQENIDERNAEQYRLVEEEMNAREAAKEARETASRVEAEQRTDRLAKERKERACIELERKAKVQQDLEDRLRELGYYDEPAMEEDTKDLDDAILAVFDAYTMDTSDTEYYNKRGLPRLRQLRRLSGRNYITVPMRNRLWTIWKEKKEGVQSSEGEVKNAI